MVIGFTYQLVGLINRKMVEDFNLEIDREGGELCQAVISSLESYETWLIIVITEIFAGFE